MKIKPEEKKRDTVSLRGVHRTRSESPGTCSVFSCSQLEKGAGGCVGRGKDCRVENQGCCSRLQRIQVLASSSVSSISTLVSRALDWEARRGRRRDMLWLYFHDRFFWRFRTPSSWSIICSSSVWSSALRGATEMSRTARNSPQLFRCSFSRRKKFHTNRRKTSRGAKTVAMMSPT